MSYFPEISQYEMIQVSILHDYQALKSFKLSELLTFFLLPWELLSSLPGLLVAPLLFLLATSTDVLVEGL